jgi:acyl-CoA thioesterase
MEMLGIEIESADEREAVVRMEVPDGLMSPFGTVHGGAIATLLDTALAVAISRRLDGPDRIATHNLNVSYISFARERGLVCHTRVVSLRHAVAVAEGEVLTAGGTLVAKALGTFGVRRHAA